MGARMKDIAQDLGLSLMTISKALRGHRDISEQTRNRVIKRARELDYRPNWVARSLVTRRTHMVGLVIPDLMHSFFAEVAKGVSRKLEPAGYQIFISNSEENPEAESRQVELLMARSIDGLIVASAQATGRDPEFRDLAKRGVPYVLVDRMPQNLEGHFVGVAHDQVGELATTHLIEQGCRRVGHIRGHALATGEGRLRGYRTALRRHKLKARADYVVSGNDDETGYAAMQELLRLNPAPDGVFCYNDPVAAGAIKAVLEAGLRVPEDIAIVGAGNVHYSDLLRVPLSTVDQNSSATGETAAELLLECIEAKAPLPPRHILIPPRLVARESSLRRS
jgi:LacI family transcriptional regulator